MQFPINCGLDSHRQPKQRMVGLENRNWKTD